MVLAPALSLIVMRALSLGQPSPDAAGASDSRGDASGAPKSATLLVLIVLFGAPATAACVARRMEGCTEAAIAAELVAFGGQLAASDAFDAPKPQFAALIKAYTAGFTAKLVRGLVLNACLFTPTCKAVVSRAML